jgi:hypothetical protein
LKQVEVSSIKNGHIDRRTPERLGRVQAAKTSTEYDNAVWSAHTSMVAQGANQKTGRGPILDGMAQRFSSRRVEEAVEAGTFASRDSGRGLAEQCKPPASVS